jgi:hypothetical protein
MEEVTRELEDSRAAILSHVDSPQIALSFPHGRTSESISQLAQSLGYSCALTGTLGLNGNEADLFALRRTNIASDDDLATFAARVSGLTWWANRLRSFIFNTESKDELQTKSSVSYESVVAETYDYAEPTG